MNETPLNFRRLACSCFASAALLVGIDGRASAQDATDGYPYGSVAYFNLQACPAGWQAYDAAAGRTAVPVDPAVATPLKTVGTALSSKQDPVHGKPAKDTHSVTTSIDLPSVEYALISGGGNDNLARHGKATVTGDFNDVSANVPYVQLLVCWKTSTTTVGQMPNKVAFFFGGRSCPSGTDRTLTTAGRLLVGLPAKGTAGTAFGGDPLKPQEDRTHTHDATGSITTSAYMLGAVSGCCAHGYGKNGKYKFDGTSVPSSTNFPYIQLMQCQIDRP
jgi:hypothetical protein